MIEDFCCILISLVSFCSHLSCVLFSSSGAEIVLFRQVPTVGLILNLSRAIHARQREDRVSIWPRCSGQTRSILTAHAQLVNSKILRMDVVDLGKNIDRMLLPAIYWTFEMAIGAISDQTLRGFLQRLRGRFGIAERCLELTIRKFKVSLSTKDFKVTPEFPKGRFFEIDCEEQ